MQYGEGMLLACMGQQCHLHKTLTTQQPEGSCNSNLNVQRGDKCIRSLAPTFSSPTQATTFSTKWLNPKKLATLLFNCLFFFLKKKKDENTLEKFKLEFNQCYQTLGKSCWMTRVFQRNLFCVEVNFKHFSSLPDDLILDEPMKDKALQRHSNYFASCSQNMFCWDNTTLQTSVGLAVKQSFILLQHFRLSSNLYFFLFFTVLLSVP